MSLSTVFSKLGEVVRMPGEFFIVSRAECDFKFSVEMGEKYKGSGYVLLINIIDHTNHFQVSFGEYESEDNGQVERT